MPGEARRGRADGAASTVLRLIADVVWNDEESTVPILVIVALAGLVVSLWAAFQGVELVGI